ncbi:hypothetical protein BH10ACT2_BH10ACT2_00340 [soil metagenome]
MPFTAVATAAMWRSDSVVPAPGLDQGWAIGLSMARREGLRYGHDISFTYGPLGFAIAPTNISRSGLLISMLVTAILCGTIALGTYWLLLMRTQRRVIALTGALGLILLAPNANLLCESAAIVIGCMMIDQVVRRRLPADWWHIALGFLAAILVLAKISSGLVVLIASAAFAVAWPLWLRRLALTAAAFLLTFLSTWIALGQHLSDIVPWFLDSLSLSSGYSWAMGIEDPNRRWEFFVAMGFFLSLVCWAAVQAVNWFRSAREASRRTAPEMLALAAMAAVLFLATFKEGFVRHDGHVTIFFFGMMYVVATLTRWTAVRYRGSALAGLSLSVLCFAAATGYPLSANLDPSPSASAFFVSVNQIVSTDAWTMSLQAAGAAARNYYQVPQEVLDAVEGHSVHIDPFDLAVAWAYGLDWLPPLASQRYSEYTERIDSRTAARLTAGDGPERILRSTDPAIDGRFNLLDGPQTVAAYLCDYRSVEETERWQVLSRTDHRCGALQQISRNAIAAGETFDVPALSAPNQMLFVSIEFDVGVAREAFATLYKADAYRMYLDDIGYKVLPTTTGQPGPVFVPEASGWGAAFRGAEKPPETIRLSHPAVVTFYSMTISQ